MSKKFSSKIIKFVVLAGISIALIFFNPAGFFNPVRNIFLRAAYPFQKTFYLLGRKVDQSASFFSHISTLRKENEELIKENNFLASEVALLQGEKKENEILRNQLSLAPRDKFSLEASFVIGQDPQKLANWILIDKGSANGIERNMPVIVSGGILIGKIDEVFPNSSKVVLLSDSSSFVNAVDVDSGAKGIVKGEYGLGIVLDMVTQSEVLNKNETVVTSGLGSDIPRGLLIGKIQEVRVSEDRLFQQALIVPRVKYTDLEVVLVLKK